MADVNLRSLLRAQAGAKAFNPTPSWEDPHSVGVVDLQLGRLPGMSPNGRRGITGGQRRQQKGAERYTSAYAGSQAMDWVGNCIRYWADAVSTADYHFEKPRKLTDVKAPGDSVEAPAALEKLFEDPNPYQDYAEMMELLVMDLLLTGNAYLFKWRINSSKQPLALYRLAPPYVEVKITPWGPLGYNYQIPNADKLEILPEELIHFKLANPDAKDPYYGAGFIQAAGRAADLEIALTHTQSSYYENRAMPSVAVESERRVPRDVFKKMRAQLRARAQGPGRAGELLVLEAGLKLSSIAPNATEAAFAAVSQMSRDRVYGWFKMHPGMTGIATDKMYKGMITELKQQWDSTAARPFMDKLQNRITSKMVKEAWNLAYVIDYEYQLTPEERAELGGMVSTLPGVTVDQALQVGGYPPHKDKETGKITLNLPGEEGGGGGPGEVASRNGFPDKNLPGEKGRPPKPGNTRAFPKKGKPMPAGAKARKVTKKALTLDEVESRLEALIASPVSRLPDDLLADDRVASVDHATGAFVGNLTKASRVLERGLLDAVEGKAFDDSTIVSKLRNSAAWDAFDVLAKESYEKALTRVMSAAAIHHTDLGLKPESELDYEAMIKDLTTRSDSGISAITQTFKDSVSDAVKDAKGDATSMADVQDAVQQAVSDWNSNKAEMIALTEATRGYNESTLAVAEKSGVNEVVVFDGDEDDEPCIQANGETWTVDYAREHLLEHPRCRRAFVPLR